MQVLITLPQLKPRWTALTGIEEAHEMVHHRIADVRALISNGRLDPNLRWAADAQAPNEEFATASS